jgi:hypothetical protein
MNPADPSQPLFWALYGEEIERRYDNPTSLDLFLLVIGLAPFVIALILYIHERIKNG